jgi:hypothetical protein
MRLDATGPPRGRVPERRAKATEIIGLDRSNILFVANRVPLRIFGS